MKIERNEEIFLQGKRGGEVREGRGGKPEV
jgi:hypothetical protein